MSTQYGDEQTTRGYPAQEQRPYPVQEQERGDWGRGKRRRPKPFFATSEFVAMVAAVTAVAIAAAVADNFESPRAWTLITILAAAYIISRGLSKINRGDGHLGND